MYFLTAPSLSHPIQSLLEQVQSQTKKLSRDVKFLQNELMEKNNRMEQLLVLLAEKNGIQLDADEADRPEEQEAHSHP